MNVFQNIPDELFSVLASPNRRLYADALEILYQVYQESLKIPEGEFYSALRGNLERQLAETTFEGEDISPEELRDVSGRTRFLMRKLRAKGWFEKERGQDFTEYLTVPEYSSKILELLHRLSDNAPLRGDSLVFGTYSTLKVAHEENDAYRKMSAVYSAYDNTRELVKLLKSVYHNVRHYFQIQLELQNVNQALASHFDDFGQKVVEAHIRPLKIKDSVPKYRVQIQAFLDAWLEDNDLFSAMTEAAWKDKRGESPEACRTDLLQKIYWVKERYECLEREFLSEIDRQVRRYTRAATQKIENLTNRDRNVRGNLNYLLTALSRNPRAGELAEEMQSAFQLYEQSYLSDRSLWNRAQGVRKTFADPVAVDESDAAQAVESELLELTRAKYGKTAVREYVRGLLESRDVCRWEELELPDDGAYVTLLLAVVNSSDSDAFYTVETENGGSVKKGAYEIPKLVFRRKGRGIAWKDK